MNASQSCSQIFGPLEFIEREIRCAECDKLFTKIKIMVDHDLHVEGDVKIGIETKCRGCKKFDNKVFVV